MSDNIDNLLRDIYSSRSQSQGFKELANLINNLSQLLLKAISQLESRVLNLEQQLGVKTLPRPQQPTLMAPTQIPTTPPSPKPTIPAPKPKTASPFSVPTTLPPPQQKPARSMIGEGPATTAEAASMLGVTLKKVEPKSTPATTGTSLSTRSQGGSNPSFLTNIVNPEEKASTTASDLPQVDAMAPTGLGSGTGIGAPGGGFRGELAEKLARRLQKVEKQIDDDFDAPDLSKIEKESKIEEGEEEASKDSTSNELKTDLEVELRNAFSKLKG